MKIWKTWLNIVYELRESFSREKTFLWFATVLLGFTLRNDLHGVTSFIRALELKPKFYQGLLDFFHSSAVKISRLTVLWCQICLKWIGNRAFKVNGRFVLLADGIKIPKEGHQMPGVKLLHQESNNNSKPEYIMGHSCQVVSLLIRGLGVFFSLPLTGRIHEGIKYSPNEKKTILEKLLELLGQIEIKQFYLIADSYYACRAMISGLIAKGCHLISVVRSNAVAYMMPKISNENKKGRGRPSKYGKKIILKDIFKIGNFVSLLSPLYNDVNVYLKYYTMDLLCKSAGGVLLRYVWVDHPTRGKIIFVCTDLALSAPQIIELYGKRFKIEVMFRQAVHVIGAFAYKFWSKIKDRTKKGDGDEYLHKKDEFYKQKIMNKINAYNLFIQVGLIAQGIIIIISASSPKAVWKISQLWTRNNPKDKSPSEWIVKNALQLSFPEFLEDLNNSDILKKFLRPKFKTKGIYYKIINFSKRFYTDKAA